jgi:hypothetical protein
MLADIDLKEYFSGWSVGCFADAEVNAALSGDDHVFDSG